METSGSWNLFGSKRLTSGSSTVRVAFRPMLESLEDRCVLAAVSFTDATQSGDWNTAANWSNGAIPTQNDDVTIPAGKTCTEVNGGDCKSLVVKGTLNLANTLSGWDGNVTNDGFLEIRDGATLMVLNQKEVTNNGSLLLGAILSSEGGGGIEAKTVINNNGFFVHLVGLVTGNFVNNKDITIADETQTPSGATLTVSGDYTQVGAGKISLSVHSNNKVSKLVVGKATLAGAIVLDAPANYKPPDDILWTVVEYTSRFENTKFGTRTEQLGGKKLDDNYLPTKLIFSIAKKIGQAAPPVQGTEGTAVSGTLATFTDPGRVNPTPADYEATVNWGDGSSSSASVVANSQGGFDVVGSHTYASFGGYQFTVTIQDAIPPHDPITVTGLATIQDAIPTVTASAPSSVPRNTAWSGSGSFTDPGTNNWYATINFGMGDQPLTLNPDKTFNFSHVFMWPGTFAVTIKVWDGMYYGQKILYVTVTM